MVSLHFDLSEEPIIHTAQVPDAVYEKWLSEYPAKRRPMEEFLDQEFLDRERLKAIEKMNMATIPVLRDHRLPADFGPKLASFLENEGAMEFRIFFMPSESFMERLYNGKPEDAAYQIESSNGNVFADRDGNVIHLDESWKDAEPGCMIPLKFDLGEYRDYWQEEPKVCIDILDLGFAGNLGLIEPAAMEWRREMRKMLDDEIGAKPCM